MALDTATILAQIDDVLARCGASKDNPRPRTAPPVEGVFAVFVDGNGTAMSTACMALIKRLAPGSSYETAAEIAIASGDLDGFSTVSELVGVVAALREDVEAGYTQSLVELVHAD